MTGKEGLVERENIIDGKIRVLIHETRQVHHLLRWLIRTQDLTLGLDPIFAKTKKKTKRGNDAPDPDPNRDPHLGGVQEDMKNAVTIRSADVLPHLSRPEIIANHTRDDD